MSIAWFASVLMAKAADEDMRYALATRARSANAGLNVVSLECERANYTPWNCAEHSLMLLTTQGHAQGV